jgi:hypothetical protein
MTPQQSEARVRELLRGAGVDYHDADPGCVLEVFREFAAEAVECDDESLLFQAADARVHGETYLDFVRGYQVLSSDGRKVDLFLHLELNPQDNEELGMAQVDLCSWGYPSLDAFFKDVERSEAFEVGLLVPKWRLRVYLGEVAV